MVPIWSRLAASMASPLPTSPGRAMPSWQLALGRVGYSRWSTSRGGRQKGVIAEMPMDIELLRAPVRLAKMGFKWFLFNQID